MQQFGGQTTLVRVERPDDYAAIEVVHQAAFDGEGEARLVARLRAMDDFIPGLSLVAVQSDQVVGHILFSLIRIESEHTSVPALALAPMAVLPAFQNKGIGTVLVKQGLDACRRLQYRIIVVVGHANYYPRFGFVPAREHGIEAPFPVPDEAFMILQLMPGALGGVRGTVRYPPPFEEI
jgi:putative acetyltransferase